MAEENIGDLDILREKFTSLFKRKIINGDSNTTLTILQSLIKICKAEPDLLVSSIDSCSENKSKSKEFSCWLISELLLIDGSEEVENSVHQLIVYIFNTISSRSPQLFDDYTKDFLNIGQGAVDVMFEGDIFQHDCFTSLVDANQANFIPMKIEIPNNEQLDRLDRKIIRVLGSIVDQLWLYANDRMKSTWMLVGMSLEIGSISLKSTSLLTIKSLMKSSVLPSTIQLQDYILQLIGGCISYSIKEDCLSVTNHKIFSDFEMSLLLTLQELIVRLSSIDQLFIMSLVHSLEQDLSRKERFSTISGVLLKEILRFTVAIIDSSSNTEGLRRTLRDSALHNSMMPEVIDICLKRFLLKDFKNVVPVPKNQSPSTKNKLKRKADESELETVLISASEVSPVWKNVEDNIKLIMEQLVKIIPLECYLDNCNIFINYLDVASDVLASLPSENMICVQFLPDSIFGVLTEMMIPSIKGFCDIDKVTTILKLLHRVVFITNASRLHLARPSDKSMEGTWVALACIPWLANNISTKDLKAPNLKAIISIASKANWANDVAVKKACIPVLCSSAVKIAPVFRYFVIQNILSEGNVEIINVLVEWFPMLLIHIPKASAQALLGDAIGLFLNCQDPRVKVTLSETLSSLYCSVLRLNELKPRLDHPCSPSSLVCQIDHNCPTANKSLFDETQNVIDQALGLRLLNVLDDPSKEICVNVIRAFPAILAHNKISKNLLNSIVKIISFADTEVVDLFTEHFYLFFSSQNSPEISTIIDEHILLQMQGLLESEKCTIEMQRAIITTLQKTVQLKRMKSSETFWNVWMTCLTSIDKEVCAISHLVVQDWAKALSVSPKQIYLQDRKVAAKVVIRFFQDNNVSSLLTNISEAFQWRVRNSSYTKSQLQYILPPLIVKVSEDSKPYLLVELATFLDLRLSDLIIKNIHHIFAYLVFNYDDTKRESIQNFISKVTGGKGFKDIMPSYVQNIVHELSMGLHKHKKVIMKEFVCMESSQTEKPYENYNNTQIQESISRFLSPRLLGILGFLDGKLATSYTMLEEKKSALLGVKELIISIDSKHISSVARKILTSLKTARKNIDPEIDEILCDVWCSYLNRIHESTLKEVLEESLIIILPLNRKFPEKFQPILEDCVGKLEDKCLWTRIPLMLPESSAYDHLKKKLYKYQEPFHGSLDSVVEYLKLIHSGLLHESLEVKKFYLARLQSVLTEHQNIIHQLILDSDRAHTSISDVYKTLLDLCREKEDIIILVAECIGLIGAIDPARLSIENKSGYESNNFTNISTKEFVLSLIQDVSRSVLSAIDTHTQTCALYAMQEILRLYKIGGTATRCDLGAQVYEELPNNIRELLHPLHNSKYIVTGTSKLTSQLPCPLYGTKHAQTFNQWLTNWVVKLVDLLVVEKSKQVFYVCKPLMRQDKVTAIKLLPPLFISVLTESSENHNTVLSEILAVVEEDRCNNATSNESNPSSNSNSNRNFQTSSKLQHMAVQTIFTCLDNASRWIYIHKKKHATFNKGKAISFPIELERMVDFMDQIPSETLAKISFKCQSYSRALRSLECYLENKPEMLKNNLRFLQKIYIALDEPDGVAGVAAIRQEDPSLEEQIIEYEATGRIHDAISCYERLCTSNSSTDCYKGMLQSYLNIDQPQSVLNITQGIISQNPDMTSELNEFRVEAAWRLGQWTQLENFMNKDEMPPSWGVGVGKLFLAAKSHDQGAFDIAMKHLRAQTITPISAASMELGAFQRAGPYIARLQILNELQELLLGLLNLPMNGTNKVNHLTLENLNDRWEKRLSLVQTSYRSLQPILSFRRTLLQIGQDWCKEINPDLSNALSVKLQTTWLQSAKVTRKSGLCEQGEWAFFGTGHGKAISVERAKWFWIKGDRPKAVLTLKRGIEKFFSNINTSKEKIECAKAKLLLAHYSEESATMETQFIKQLYRDVCDINKHWEDGHYNLSMYYDRILNTMEVKEKPADWLFHIVSNFGKSLQYGCKYLYQSMPRLLSIWLDLGTKVSRSDFTQKDSQEKVKYVERLKNINEYLLTLINSLPLYMFLVALPQLISRICHSNEDVIALLIRMLATILEKYPQQSMWHFMQVSKSSYEMRRTRCLQVFKEAQKNNSKLCKFISDSTKLSNLFIELANKNVPKGTLHANLSSISKNLSSVIANKNFSNIILPLQNQMTVTLPSVESNHSLETLMGHNPFPKQEIYLSGVDDNVEIMQSLVQPKKITLRGSDGKKYFMMCKPKDDLRKDCRLMEFNLFVNRLLMKNPESRKRDLKIRTYTVVPLNEECGLLEWVPNLTGLRQILSKLYKEAGQGMSGAELKKAMCQVNDPYEKKKKVFLQTLLPKYPPVFGKWFLNTFIDPQSWLQARVAYCRTAAVMSMVGYILGLGDRHGENILCDSTTGDIVHVDFNCLFNKGATFDWPERVPFRLTHNLVSAMGPTGYEGVFRTTAQVTMSLMRKELEQLMSVLKPFIYDPLVEWEKKTPGKSSSAESKTTKTGEIFNVKAQKLVADIEERLNGLLRSKQNKLALPLSVEGQVNYLIEEATSIENLSQMYIGWAPYM